MNNLFSVKDQVVVITGGTGVLGKAIAAHLAEEGAKVVILGRKAEVGNAIVNEIKATDATPEEVKRAQKRAIIIGSL